MLKFFLGLLLLLHGAFGLLLGKLRSIGLVGDDTLYDYVDSYGPTELLHKLWPKNVYGVPTVNGLPVSKTRPYLIPGAEFLAGLLLLWPGNRSRYV